MKWRATALLFMETLALIFGLASTLTAAFSVNTTEGRHVMIAYATFFFVLALLARKS